MKEAESLIACIFLAILYVTVACGEYHVVMRFGILPGVFVGFFALFVLLGALLRAPEGYEDETGFYIGALPAAAVP